MRAVQTVPNTTAEDERRAAIRAGQLREANAVWEENEMGEGHRIKVIAARAAEAMRLGGRNDRGELLPLDPDDDSGRDA